MNIDKMTDYEVIATALLMWRNHIETGSVNMCRQDAINCGQEKSIKKLDDYQRSFCDRLSNLSSRSIEINSLKKLNSKART